MQRLSLTIDPAQLPAGNKQPARAAAISRLRAAERAADDPVKLERAARIIRAAIAQGKITVDELTAGLTTGGSDGA